VSDRFVVEGLDSLRWEPITVFEEQDRAFDYAKLLERRRRCERVRVVVETRRDGRTRRLVTYLGKERPEPRAREPDMALGRRRGWGANPLQGRVLADLLCAGRVVLGAGFALAVGGALIAGLRLLG
jgi:hypothetical protein